MSRYTIERVTLEHLKDDELFEWFRNVGREMSARYGYQMHWVNFRIQSYVQDHRMMLCRRDGKPVGVMLSRLYDSILDPNVRILMQDLLYGKSGTRASKYLLADFIDFGKANANHVISMIGERTNIKGRSLENLGFKKLETLYRLEI